MKKMKNALTLLSAATLLALGACTSGGSNSNQQSSQINPGESASESVPGNTEAAYPLVIKKETLPYLEEGVKFDLDKYISVEMSDGQINHEYTVTCNKADMIIEGHKVKSDVIGTYTLVVTAGSLSSKVTVEVLSNEQIKLIDFLSPLEDEPNNFTVDLYDGETYMRTSAHTAKYALSYNKDNPGALDDEGEPNSFVLAYLNDNNGYAGYLTQEGTVTKPVFEPGIIKNLDWYYLMIGMQLDAADSGYTFMNGKDCLMLGPSFTENLLAYGCSMPMAAMYDDVDYGYTIMTDLKDTGMDGNPDEATFVTYLEIEGESEPYEWITIKLHDVGTTSLPFMETAIKSDSYIPETIVANEITTAFAAINQAGSYTVTANIYSVNPNAEDNTAPYVPNPTDVPGDAACLIYGSPDTMITSKVTANGVYSELKQKELTQQGNGYVAASEYTLGGASAVWNASNKGYYTQTNEDGAFPAATEIAGCTNVFTLAGVKQLTAEAVNAAAVNSTNWTKKTANDAAHTVTYAGDVGDNDGIKQENLLFKAMMNMLGSTDYGVLSNMGTQWTDAVDSTTGNKFALTTYSDYKAFTVNTTTNEIDATILMYAPYSDVDQGYFGIRFKITAIGTTTHDFSPLMAGVANVGLLA